MARINVEDDILRNPRFQALIRFLDGDMEKALGRVIRFWWTAQQHWGRQENLVPLDEFAIGGFEGLEEVGLAEVRADGVYAKGAKEHFDWYRQRIEAAKRGGQKSAASRRKHGSAVPTNASNAPKQNRSTASDLVEAKPKQNRSTAEAKPNPLTLNTANHAVDKSADPPPGSAVWEAYQGAYFARYKVAPVRNAKSNGICYQLVKRLGVDAAIGVVRFYLTHNQAYYVTKSHALGPCLSDAEALHTQMINGVKVTRGSASQADSAAGNLQTFENVARKWAEREKETK